MPSMRGIRRSTTTASTSTRSIRARASTPSLALSAWSPSCASIATNTAQSASSSSTTSTVRDPTAGDLSRLFPGIAAAPSEAEGAPLPEAVVDLVAGTVEARRSV